MILSSLFVGLILPTISNAISCLVLRHGHGLISEQCPTAAVGCRIRVFSDRIGWYEWARLYERNQLVCVFPEEFPTRNGCQRRGPVGSVRCWCGTDDCNDAENSKSLLEEFIGTTIKTTTPTTTTTSTTTTKTSRRIPTTTSRIKPSTRRISPTTISPQSKSIRTTTQTTPIQAKKIGTTVKVLSSKKVSQLSGDETFEAARKRLAAEMKEEDERLQALLRDEEQELSEETDTTLSERQEDEQLARIDQEEEQLRRSERRQPAEYNDDDEDDYDYSSSNIHFISFLLPLLLLTFL